MALLTLMARSLWGQVLKFLSSFKFSADELDYLRSDIYIVLFPPHHHKPAQSPSLELTATVRNH